MEVLGDLSADSLCGFVEDNIARGSTVKTDAWQGYMRLARLGYDHRPKSQRAGLVLGEDIGEMLPRVHRTISNLKTWLRGTYRGVSEHQLQVYLDEFVFGSTAGALRWRRSRPCSASDPVCRRPLTRKSRTALSSQRSNRISTG